MNHIEAELFFRNRLTDLRIRRQISEYKMSTDLGHSNSYIHSISSGRSLPSMREFFYICEYYGMSPCEFFDSGNPDPAQIKRLTEYAKKLSPEDLQIVNALAERLSKNES